MKWRVKMSDWGKRLKKNSIDYQKMLSEGKKMKTRCPTCDTCGFEEDENYEHSTCSVCLGMGYIIEEDNE